MTPRMCEMPQAHPEHLEQLNRLRLRAYAGEETFGGISHKGKAGYIAPKSSRTQTQLGD